MVVDTWFKYEVIALVFIQLLFIYAVQDLPWNIVILASCTLCGLLNHWLLSGIHEISHNVAFGNLKPTHNRLFGIFANIPIGVPCSIAFKKYHIDHHKYLATEELDPDLPTELEARLFTNTPMKFIWVVFQGFFYAFRPLIVRPKPLSFLEGLNFVIQLLFDALVYMYLGPKSLAYMILGSFFGLGIHPVAGHLISEHYMFEKGFETYSYYGPLNYVSFHVGYHNEHHDFPNIPGRYLSKVKEIAPEYYDNLPYHNSLLKVVYDFITDPAIGSYARVKRKAHPERQNNGHLNREANGHINGRTNVNTIANDACKED